MVRFILLACVSLLGYVALADTQSEEGSNIRWNYYRFSDDKGETCVAISDGYYRVTGENLGDITVPSHIDNYPVRKIGREAFLNARKLTSIIIPEGVTTIDDDAFNGCSALTSVHMPSTVTSIGSYAFRACSSLKTIDLPEGLLVIGDCAFMGCTGLIRVGFPSTITTIGYFAFDYCTSLNEVDIPEGVKTIGGYAFSGCYSLAKVSVPNSVEVIVESAFSGCNSIIDISVPSKMGVISTVFPDSYKSIRHAKIANGSIEIPDKMFEDCKSLEQVELPVGLESIGQDAFGWCSSLSSIALPDDVVTVGDGAFRWCSSLTMAKIPSGVSCINDSTFCGCSSLETIDLPDSLVRIGDGAFEWCESLSSLTLSESIEIIGRRSFTNCSSLQAIELPSRMSVIDDALFSGCTSLRSIKIPDNVCKIGEWAFDRCESLESIDIPKSVNDIGAGGFCGCISLREIVLPNDLPRIADNAFSGCSQLDNVIIPENVTTIGRNAFARCESLSTINIPQGTMSIGEFAFSNCTSLTSISIPESIVSIGDLAFGGWTSLETVHINDIGKWCNISFGYGANPCNTSTRLFLEGEELTKIEIPQGVTRISDYAFEYCSNITSIVLPESLVSIGNYAFYECEDLIDITMYGAIEEIGENAFAFWNASTKLTVIVDNWKRRDTIKALFDNARIEVLGRLKFVCSSDTPMFDGDVYAIDTEINDYHNPNYWQSTIYKIDLEDGLCDKNHYIINNNEREYACIANDDEMISGFLVPFYASPGQKFEAKVMSGNMKAEHIRTMRVLTDNEKMALVGWRRQTLDEYRYWILIECNSLDKAGEKYLYDLTAHAIASGGMSIYDYCKVVIPEANCPKTISGYKSEWMKIGLEGYDCCFEAKMWNIYTMLSPNTGNKDWTELGQALWAKNEDLQDEFDAAFVWYVSQEMYDVYMENITKRLFQENVNAGLTASYDELKGIVVKPSDEATDVVITIPEGVDAEKVTIEVSPTVQSVKANGATIKVMKGAADITEFLDIPAAVDGVVNLGAAEVKEEIVKAALDTEQGAEIDLGQPGMSAPTITTAATKPGLTYTLVEGTTLDAMANGDSKLGDGTKWTPNIKVKGGASGFYTIKVTK